MKLNEQQHRQLLITKGYATSSPGIIKFVLASWKGYVLLIFLCAVSFYFFQWAGWHVAGFLFAGMILGTIVRDLGWYRRIVISWPLTREITDWKRVDELLEQHKPDPSL